MTNVTHNSFLCIYFNSLHVSSNLVLIIRRINCINTTSGICHSVSMTVSCAGRKGTLPTCFRGMHRDDSTFSLLESAGLRWTQWLSHANTILDIQAVPKTVNFLKGWVTSSFSIRTCSTALRPSPNCQYVGPHLTMGRQKHNTSETSKSCLNFCHMDNLLQGADKRLGLQLSECGAVQQGHT